ncbi:hypothetical protein BDR05DRAFT_1005597 [Suillus weaverae]|nr:hypothetical protein BDR05DRAFT_1005597 [Suillus weaverae]
MSSHSTSTSVSAAAAANQALIALVAWLTEMVQDVIQLPLQGEKMELSWKIARQVNDVIHTLDPLDPSSGPALKICIMNCVQSTELMQLSLNIKAVHKMT